MIKKLSILVLVVVLVGLVNAEVTKLDLPANLYSICPNPIKYEQVINSSDLLQNEDTIKYDGPNTNSVGLSSGGTFYGAVRFTPTNACTLKSVIFYQGQAVTASGFVYIHEAGTPTAPGAKIDSAPYTNAPTTWVRVTFPTPRFRAAGIDFWLNVRVTHSAGTYPLGIDGGPSVTPIRSWVSLDGTSWQSLPGVGLNYNWNIRAIVRYPSIANDVGVDAIIMPASSHRVNVPIQPIAIVKNYGAAAQTNFQVVCSIVGAGGAIRYIDTQTIPSLAVGDTFRVNFTSWTPANVEICTVKMRTNLAGDQDPANDRKTRITNIHAFLLAEGFNDSIFPPSGWQAIPLVGSYNWERKTANTNPTCTPYEGAAMASYPSYSAVAGNMARLKSPPIALGATPSVCTLRFYMYHDSAFSGGQYGPDSVKVEYSTDSTNFTRVAAFRRWEPGAPFWYEHTVYLGSFSGTIYIGLLGFSQYGNNANIDYVRLSGPIGIAEENSNQTTFNTMLNAPNPVIKGLAHISFSIAKPTQASLKIYDASGRIVKTLVNSRLDRGTYNLTWNGTDDNNHKVAEGIYFYTLTTDNNNYTKKLVFTR